MLAKADAATTWAEMTGQQIADAVSAMAPRHFVITGGEPCAQPIGGMLQALSRLGRVQVETSGTQYVDAGSDVWVTVSPKIDMPGKMKVLRQALARANEIKMPVAGLYDLEALDGLLEDASTTAEIWLQPVSQDAGATELCMEVCAARNWRLSLQTHKYAGIR